MPTVSPVSFMTGTMMAVFCISQIVRSRYRNWYQVMKLFGRFFSCVCSFGFASPWMMIRSFAVFLALPSIADRTSSSSYSSPPHVLKTGL